MDIFPRRTHFIQRLPIWLAVCALVFAALSPTLARVFVTVPAGSVGWVDVCSTTGMVRVQLSDSEADLSGKAPPAPGAHTTDCAWCLIHGGNVALPHWPVVSFSLSVAMGQSAPLFASQPPSVWRGWSQALSRAPPFLS